MTRSQTTPSSSQIITLERLLSEREDEIARTARADANAVLLDGVYFSEYA